MVVKKPNPKNAAPRAKDALRGELLLLKVAKRLEQYLGTRFHGLHKSSLSRFDVLANLDKAAGVSLSTSQLAAQLIASSGNITRLLDRMEQDGLVSRRQHAVDRRVSDVTLTEAGRRKFREAAADHELWMSEVFDALSDAEASQLIRLLGKIRVRMDAMLEPGS